MPSAFRHHSQRLLHISCVALIACVAVIETSTPSLAYRPFDGTDAAVAAEGEVEIELGPVGRLREGSSVDLIAPAIVFNYGFAAGWELVMQGLLRTPQDQPGSRTDLGEIQVNLKHVLREGVLQDKTGPSIATEFGLLVPGTDAGEGTHIGGQLAGIISQRFDWGTAHLNFSVGRTTDQNTDLFTSIILEGPDKWKVRPVAEFYYDDRIANSQANGGRVTQNAVSPPGQTRSALVGLIWQVRDDLAFDVAERVSSTNGVSANEIRAGVTFAFKPFEGSKAKHE